MSMQRRILLSTLLATPALAQPAWPERPVRIVVPDGAGGGNDTTARVFAMQLERVFNLGFPVDNRAGGGGRIGVEHVYRSAPDGATLLLGNAGSNGINGALYRDLPYDLTADFTPISLLVTGPNALAVNPKELPARDVPELLRLLRARPAGSVNYASAGPGSSAHFSMELFKAMTGLDLTHVPYRGAAAMAQAAQAGDTPILIANLVNIQPLIARGDLRLLAVTSRERWPGTPDVPTLHESGLEGYETLAWNGLFGPPGLSPAIGQRLLPELRRIATLPEVRSRIAAIGGTLVVSDPATLTERVRADVAKWRRLADQAGIRPE
ncbi:tripartite tricarboxylate transporter substrate binding protein [Rhodovarius crocodyli]|uniref:Tripartite tricarboxylate transporter substrate binding protein n=2 Tax=Rhodovarius crocodyli TaxID=1979269 RepID=A0A437MIN5_9PROT|nr:tripartite tricarboxylate transporter substrate binding protein [Rhodovarius crocodyli]